MPKAFVRVAGITLLDRAVEQVRGSGVVARTVVVVPRDRVAEVAGLLPGAVVVAGGSTRQESVRAGLRVLDTAVDVVLVHDAARALTPPRVFADVVDAVRSGHDVVVPAVELHDTVRALDGDASVLVERSTLRAVQTPQGFRREVLERAHAHRGVGAPPATDDATLAERAGHRVFLVPGAPEAFKVTRPLDLILAESLVAASRVLAGGCS